MHAKLQMLTIASSFLMVASVGVQTAIADESPAPVPCYDTSVAKAGQERQGLCVRNGGRIKFRAIVYCELPDGSWVHNDYWKCVGGTVGELQEKKK